MAEKQTNKERLKEITDSIEAGIKDLFQSERYMEYLRTMSRFHRYSINNTLLIHMQMPDATLVAGFNKWKNEFSRYVKRGEKGIKIIAPAPFKKKIEAEKLDPDTKLPMYDKDGNIIIEEKEVKIPMFRPVTVFDVSQTEGEPLPSISSELKGDVRHYEVFLEALRRSSPVPIDFKALASELDGYFSRDEQRIAIREGMSEVQTICATVHEITHAKLHNLDAAENASEGEKVEKSRETKEVEAESVSYAVCAYYGIETGENSFGYIASWSSGKELKELRASLETIRATADGLISDIDQHFKEICKERGIDLSTEEVCADERFYKVNEGQYLHIQRCDSGYDYTFYNAKDKSEMDGGQLDDPKLTIQAAAEMACSMHDVLVDGMTVVACELPDEFVEAVSASAPKDRCTELAEHFEKEDRKFWDTTLDEYPVPDDSMALEELEAFGITNGEYLPVGQGIARTLIMDDMTVYAASSEGMELLFDSSEVLTRPEDTVFAVPKEEWESSADFRIAIENRMERQEDREKAFLDHAGDCYAIYQVKLGDDSLRDLRYMGMDYLEDKGLKPDRANYELAYTGELSEGQDLNALWEKFNIDRPADYLRPSMSVSDIVAIKRDGVVSCHYVDSFGFRDLPDFLQPENHLKAVEMQVEDDYNMLDGIINNGPKQPTVAELEQQAKSGQPISLLDLAGAVQREQEQARRKPPMEKRPSLLAKIRRPLPPREDKKTAPERSAEREYER